MFFQIAGLGKAYLKIDHTEEERQRIAKATIEKTIS